MFGSPRFPPTTYELIVVSMLPMHACFRRFEQPKPPNHRMWAVFASCDLLLPAHTGGMVISAILCVLPRRSEHIIPFGVRLCSLHTPSRLPAMLGSVLPSA